MNSAGERAVRCGALAAAGRGLWQLGRQATRTGSLSRFMAGGHPALPPTPGPPTPVGRRVGSSSREVTAPAVRSPPQP